MHRPSTTTVLALAVLSFISSHFGHFVEHGSSLALISIGLHHASRGSLHRDVTVLVPDSSGTKLPSRVLRLMEILLVTFSFLFPLDNYRIVRLLVAVTRENILADSHARV